jgi:hypothetical protein
MGTLGTGEDLPFSARIFSDLTPAPAAAKAATPAKIPALKASLARQEVSASGAAGVSSDILKSPPFSGHKKHVEIKSLLCLGGSLTDEKQLYNAKV